VSTQNTNVKMNVFYCVISRYMNPSLWVQSVQDKVRHRATIFWEIQSLLVSLDLEPHVVFHFQ